MIAVSHAWSVVGCAFLIALWGWGLGFYGLGVYLVALQEIHGWSASTISAAFTAYYLTGAALIAGLGRAMRRFGPVATVSTAVCAMAAGVTALGAITAPWHLYAACLVMAVGWASMSGAAVNLLVAPWFERQRGLALSLAFTGASAAGVVIGPGLLSLVGLLGFRLAVAVAAAVMVAVVLPVAAAVLRRRPPAGDDGEPAAARRPRPDARSPLSGPPPGGEAFAPHPVRTLAYWTISVPFAAGLVAQVGFLTHLVAFLTPLVGPPTAGLALSLTALAAIAGRFALGSAIDRTDPRLAACANFLVQIVGLGLVLARPSEAALLAGCIVFGLGVGNMVSLPGILVGREFSAAQFGGAIGLVTATNQVAFAFAPAALGVLRDFTGDYAAALSLCIGLDGLAAMVVVIGRRPGLAARASGDARVTSDRAIVVPPPDSRGERAMLQIRPSCECCDRDLPPDSRDAFICSFECTFCGDCAARVLRGRCPNCGGELVRRPVRPADKLARFPASTARVFKPEGCRSTPTAV